MASASLKERLREIIMGAEANMSLVEAQLLVNHLTSSNVGVKKLGDLALINTAMFPSGVSMMAQVKLQSVFHAIAEKEKSVANNEPRAGPSSQSDQPFIDVAQRRAANNEYTFEINWKDVNKEIRRKMEHYKAKKDTAPESLMTALRKDIKAKLWNHWFQWRQDHPEVSRKSPGRKIYEAVTEQVYAKYGQATDISINGLWVCAGGKSFVAKLEESIENKVKREIPCTNPRKFRRSATSTVGLIVEQYNPEMTPREKKEMKELKEDLKDTAKLNPSTFQWDSILDDMDRSFNLCRDELVDAAEIIREEKKAAEIAAKEVQADKKKANKAASKNSLTFSDDEEEAEVEEEGLLAEDTVEKRELKKLVENWPFLFMTKGLSHHAKRLTGRDLEARYNRFKEDDHLEFLRMFLMTSTKENITNLILQHRIERETGQLQLDWQFLMIIEMLENHFQESIDTLILTCEETTDVEVLPLTLLADRDGSICIIAFNDNKYAAKKFAVCSDQTVLNVSSNPAQAVINLINICFTCDIQYPKLPKLFEFLERFVFAMTVQESRVLKKGKQLTFVTNDIKKTCDDYEAFKSRVVTGLAQ